MDKVKKGAQLKREDMESLYEWTKEVGADPKSLIMLAMNVVHSCMDEGVQSERINMKSEDGGISTLTERFPAIAIAGIALINTITTGVQKELDREPPADPVIHIHMNRKRLEDVIEDSGES